MTRWLWIGSVCAIFAVFTPDRACAQARPDLRTRLGEVRRASGGAIPEGAFTSIEFLLDNAERIEGRFGSRAEAFRQRAARYLSRVEQGVDPFPEERGKIINRGYRSSISTKVQGYSIYLPPNYDPSRSWPTMIVLHGGSSNGNLFLGVVLGNNMDWLTYDQHLWDEFEPRWSPDWIVVAPDGFGQVMWRWMGERDVLDVLDDVQRHYNVDADRVVLCGLSNGGVGAHNVGLRHAWRFSAVLALAGAPSWLQYTGGAPTETERLVMEPLSGMSLLENAWDTNYRYFHGRTDPGPMRPAFIEALDRKVRETGVPARGTWYNAGHDVLYIVHRHGRVYDEIAQIRRTSRPSHVVVATGDYRAARQHWITVTRLSAFPRIGTVRANVEGDAITITTDQVRAFSIDLRDVPLSEGANAAIAIDGAEVYRGPRADLGQVLHVVKDNRGWRTGVPEAVGLEKIPGLSGPIADAYYGRMVHVYGTRDPEHTDALRRAAQRGSHGWPLWLWQVDQEVIADTAVTQALMEDATLVLYGTAGDNAVLERARDGLPIRIEEDAIVLGGVRHEGDRVGTRFIYPNPLAPTRYVIVQAGVTTAAVNDGHNLPDFVGDYVVYDRTATARRSRLIAGRGAMRASGFFGARWELAPAPNEGGDDAPNQAHTQNGDSTDIEIDVASWGGTLPIPVAPPLPPPAQSFVAGPRDPAGIVARELARRIPTFRNWRAEIHGASWSVDEDHAWRIRSSRACVRALRAAEVPFSLVTVPLTTPVAIPVAITGPIGGVRFESAHSGVPVVVSCELAAKMIELAEILRTHDITQVRVLSSYRDHPRPSFHTFGLALDMSVFIQRDGTRLVVQDDFEITADRATCDARPSSAKARVLLSLGCDIARSRIFSSVLTPNYNPGHRDHFHVDARPDDPRFFVR